MAAMNKTTVFLPKAVFDQVNILAQQLKVSRSHLIRLAVDNFIQNGQPGTGERDGWARMQMGESPMDVHQGDIYWVQLNLPGGLEPGYPHPHVILQEDIFNRSRIQSVVVCALTSNIRRAKSPGNVLLEAGEANLPRPSVVEVSKLSTVEKSQLGPYIGSLSSERVTQILAGIQFLQAVGRL